MSWPDRTVPGVTLLVTLVLGACDNGGGVGQPQSAPAFPASPPPAEPPTPPPLPGPPPPSGPRIANVAPGGVLEGSQACATGRFDFEALIDGARMVGISAITGAVLLDSGQDPVRIEYVAIRNFVLDPGGLGGLAFRPIDSRGSISGVYDYFRVLSEEFEIDTGQSNLQHATLGRISSPSKLCFFSAGAPTTNYLVDGDYPFAGLADGVFVSASGGDTLRLHGSVVEGTIFANAGVVAVTIHFAGRGQPFGAFQDSAPVDLGVATARIPYSGSSFSVANFDGPDGSKGTITGETYGQLVGLGFAYELTYPNGDRIFGAAAAGLLAYDGRPF